MSTRLLDQFIPMRETRKMEVGDDSLITSNEFSLNHVDSWYQEALSTWNEVFDEQKILHLLSQSDKASLKELKQIRKFALILRTSYILFDLHHDAPKRFRTLTKMLGQVNDHPQASEYRTAAQQAVIEYAHTPLEPLHRATEQEIHQEILDDQLLIKSLADQDLASIHDFHHVRKRIRNYVNICQLATVTDRSRTTLALFQFFDSLSSSMGYQHDTVIAESSTQSEYNRSRVSLSPDLKQLLSRATDIIHLMFDEKKNDH